MPKHTPEKDMVGKRRLGTVVSEAVLEAIGEITMEIATNPSKLMSVVIENWLIGAGIVRDDQRIHDPALLLQYTEAAARCKKRLAI
jgi:hypothetical protein